MSPNWKHLNNSGGHLSQNYHFSGCLCYITLSIWTSARLVYKSSIQMSANIQVGSSVRTALKSMISQGNGSAVNITQVSWCWYILHTYIFYPAHHHTIDYLSCIWWWLGGMVHWYVKIRQPEFLSEVCIWLKNILYKIQPFWPFIASIMLSKKCWLFSTGGPPSRKP